MERNKSSNWPIRRFLPPRDPMDPETERALAEVLSQYFADQDELGKLHLISQINHTFKHYCYEFLPKLEQLPILDPIEKQYQMTRRAYETYRKLTPGQRSELGKYLGRHGRYLDEEEQGEREQGEGSFGRRTIDLFMINNALEQPNPTIVTIKDVERLLPRFIELVKQLVEDEKLEYGMSSEFEKRLGATTISFPSRETPKVQLPKQKTGYQHQFKELIGMIQPHECQYSVFNGRKKMSLLDHEWIYQFADVLSTIDDDAESVIHLNGERIQRVETQLSEIEKRISECKKILRQYRKTKGPEKVRERGTGNGAGTGTGTGTGTVPFQVPEGSQQAAICLEQEQMLTQKRNNLIDKIQSFEKIVKELAIKREYMTFILRQLRRLITSWA
jgi:hypothetical protein